MEQEKLNTLEGRLRGPLISFEREKGVTVHDVNDAIDLHVIPPLTICYNELREMITGDPMDDIERERAWGYLAILRNAIAMLIRIEEEADVLPKPAYKTCACLEEVYCERQS
jgi:hypothetical protein